MRADLVLLKKVLQPGLGPGQRGRILRAVTDGARSTRTRVSTASRTSSCAPSPPVSDSASHDVLPDAVRQAGDGAHASTRRSQMPARQWRSDGVPADEALDAGDHSGVRSTLRPHSGHDRDRSRHVHRTSAEFCGFRSHPDVCSASCPLRGHQCRCGVGRRVRPRRRQLTQVGAEPVRLALEHDEGHSTRDRPAEDRDDLGHRLGEGVLRDLDTDERERVKVFEPDGGLDGCGGDGLPDLGVTQPQRAQLLGQELLAVDPHPSHPDDL